MANKTIFNKTYKSPKESIEILRERGLSITDESKAQHYLSHIGYYRLSAYMHPLLRMPKEEHLFKEGASFDKVMTLYRFDKKLRMLLFNEIEKSNFVITGFYSMFRSGERKTDRGFTLINNSLTYII